MPEALPALPRSAPEAEVDQRLLELLAQQSGRVPVAVSVLLVVMALMAGNRLPYWIAAAWFAASLTILLVRRRWLSLLPRRDDLPLPLRLRIATVLSLVNGTAHGLSLAAFPFLDETERAFFSVLLLALCTGAVGTTTGHRNIYLAYTVPVFLPLPLLWVWSAATHSHGWSEYSLALLIALYFWLLLGLARNAWKTFEESVQIRFQESDLNEQLQAALARANEASQAKTRFLAAASHDLRQPLHTIGLLVAALSLRPMAGRDKEIIGLLSQVTLALSEQLDELLDISRLDAGVVQIERRLVRLDELVRRHHAETRAAIEEKGLRAIVQCQQPVHAYTDPALLLRILRNLSDNAIKFTDSGFVAFDVVADGDQACISVADSGRGIAAEEQQKVFEELYQVGNPERDRARGLGLGLSIVRRLARLLGIELGMRSEPGTGTRFELRLPLTYTQPQPAAPAADSHGPLNARVLVLDDERAVRQGVRLLLEELGCDCSEAATTQEAVASATRSRPDVVLADMRLRGGDSGIAAVRAIREAVGHVPALLVSGDTAPDRLQEASRAGIRLLHKPVAMEVLRGAIEDAISVKGHP
jgi:signal transduction histidine kinase/CheY-like chemotaxis protein